jgi:hypothetical protein
MNEICRTQSILFTIDLISFRIIIDIISIDITSRLHHHRHHNHHLLALTSGISVVMVSWRSAVQHEFAALSRD